MAADDPDLNLGKAEVAATGRDQDASGIRATLTAGAARALNRAFRTRLFRAGLKLGTVRTSIDLADAVFKGGATTLALDPGAASALQRSASRPASSVTRPPAPAAWLPDHRRQGERRDARRPDRASGGISLTKGSTASR